uniref:Uncharacterized protein n=1 Tax=Rhizophora mucronata TaxID=61149 RepID=A0A2P2P357_RHIMU
MGNIRGEEQKIAEEYENTTRKQR